MKKAAVQTILKHAAVIGIFLLITIANFFPQIQGKVFPTHDIISYQYMSHEATQYEEETGEVTHWTNAMFGGMPTYQISSPVRSNLLKYVERTSQLFIGRPIGYFLAMMIGMYILLVVLGVNHWLAAVGAIAFGLTTNNYVLFNAGHMTKLRAVAFSAPIIAGVILTYRQKLLTGGVLFGTALGISIYANHPQMTYYLGLGLIIYVIIQLISDAKNGTLLNFAKASAILLLATALAVGASFSKIWSTYEYAKDTMRGEPILETKGEITSSSETKGLEWGYAMQWSQGGMDVMSSIIPGVVGGSGQEPVGKDAAIAKYMRGSSNPKAPLYWGSLPFTSGPPYLGAGVVFLFVLGLFLVKGKVKWWLGLATLLMVLISMGKNFEILNRILFEYFPLYNNFRAHNSVMAVAAVFLPILGALGVQRVLDKDIDKKEFQKGLYWSAGITGGLCLFFALFGGSFFDFSAAVDAQYQQAASALVADRKDLMQSDSFRSFLIIAISAGLVWAYFNNKVKSTVLFAGLGLLFTIDLTLVGKRYLDSDSFVTERQYQQNFAPRQVDEQIMQDPDLYYRVLDLSINTFNSAQASYFHKTIGGYHAAKLQRYQDMIDYHISKGNQQVLNMLNTKYIINQEEQVQRNPGAMGNGWFVSNIKMVENANQEIEALSNFDPATTAVVHKDFQEFVAGLNGSGQGTITLTDYAPNELNYSVNAESQQLAVFSEIWYGPDKGWKAYIDGEETEPIRVNYCLRGLVIPSGQHTVVFEFQPESFKKGETISYISSSLLLLAFLGMIGFKGYQWFTALPEDGTEEKSPQKSKKKKK